MQLFPALKGRAKLSRRYAAIRQKASEPFNAQTFEAKPFKSGKTLPGVKSAAPPDGVSTLAPGGTKYLPGQIPLRRLPQ